MINGGMGLGLGGNIGFPGGSYWNNTGGWGGAGGYNQWQQQQQMGMDRNYYGQSVQQANAQTMAASQQALYQQYLNSGMNMQRGSYGYGGYGGVYGGYP